MFSKNINPSDVSKDTLLKLYHDASMEASLDDDGDICVHDDYNAWVFPSPDGREIRLASYFTVNPLASQEAKLEYVNKVNNEVKLVRAYVRSNGHFGFDYYIYVDGGITRDLIVRATRRYYSCLEYALKQDEDDVVGTAPNPWNP